MYTLKSRHHCLIGFINIQLSYCLNHRQTWLPELSKSNQMRLVKVSNVTVYLLAHYYNGKLILLELLGPYRRPDSS